VSWLIFDVGHKPNMQLAIGTLLVISSCWSAAVAVLLSSSLQSSPWGAIPWLVFTVGSLVAVILAIAGLQGRYSISKPLFFMNQVLCWSLVLTSLGFCLHYVLGVVEALGELAKT
jgi:hypothetical protein